MSMNIHAQEDDKIVFSNPNNGKAHHQAVAANYLTTGAIYTVRLTIVESFITWVIIKNVPGVRFNSVLFDDYLPFSQIRDAEE